MDSLANLNSYSGTTVTFTDDRTSTIEFTPNKGNQTYFIDEGETHITRPGVDISTIINSDSDDIVYTLDVSDVVGNITVTFPSLANITVSEPSAKIYRVAGIQSVSQWDVVKYAEISTPADFSGVYTYTGNITWQGVESAAWTNTVTVVDLPELSEPANYFYTAEEVQTIQFTPQIVDEDNILEDYTLTARISNVSVVANLTITGATLTSGNLFTFFGSRTDINASLSNIVYDAPFFLDDDWNIIYTLTNPLSGLVTVKQQNIVGGNSNLALRGNATFYSENTISTLTNTPRLQTTAPGSSYTVVIGPTTANTVSTLSSTGSGGTSTFNGNTQQLTISGSLTQVNSHLGNVSYNPTLGLNTNVQLEYVFTNNLNNRAGFRQDVLYSGNVSSIVNNLNNQRDYIVNTPGLLFTNAVPQIIETITPTPTYTIQFTSGAGEFGLTENDIPIRGQLPSVYNIDPAVAGGGQFVAQSASPPQYYSFTGSKEECNNLINTLKFYPWRAVSDNQLARIRLFRNTTLVVDQSFPLFGLPRTTPLADQQTYIFDNTTYFTPTFTQARYLKMDLLLVGAGGSGGVNSLGRKGGGGGGATKYLTAISSPMVINNVNLTDGSDTSLGTNVPNVYPKLSTIYLSHKMSYYVRPGATGPTVGDDGQPSKIWNIYSAGGTSPTSLNNGGTSGASGAFGLIYGGGTSNNALYGGGGGGSRGVGLSVTTGPSATQGATGGPGFTCPIDSNIYGAGGNGNGNNTPNGSTKGRGGNHNSLGQHGRIIIKFYD